MYTVLLVLLAFFTSLSVPSIATDPSRAQEFTSHISRQFFNGTVAEFLAISSSFDDNLEDFDIFYGLIKSAAFDKVIDTEYERGISLLLPNDAALITTAKDIADLLQWEPPVSETHAFNIIDSFLHGYESHFSAVGTILMFHIIIEQFSTYEKLLTETAYPSMYFQTIMRTGLSLKTSSMQPGIEGKLTSPSLLTAEKQVLPDADNGSMYLIDRMLFPDMKGNEFRTPSEPSKPSQPPFPSATKTPIPISGGSTSPIPSRSSGPNVTSSKAPSTGQKSPPPSSTPLISSKEPFPSDRPKISPYVSASSNYTGPKFQPTPFPSMIIIGSALPSASLTPIASPSEASVDSVEPACFPGSSMVTLEDGSSVRMRDIKMGQVIQVSESDVSKVYFFSHRSRGRLATFVHITTASGHSISMTEGHYLYANGGLRAAGSVVVGDRLRTVIGASKVVQVQLKEEYGVFAPHTMQGDVVVDGIVVSTYTTAVHPAVAHGLLWPLRMLARLGIDGERLGLSFSDGIPGFAYVMPGSASL